VAQVPELERALSSYKMRDPRPADCRGAALDRVRVSLKDGWEYRPETSADSHESLGEVRQFESLSIRILSA
jgi:hypothetical protein